MIIVFSFLCVKFIFCINRITNIHEGVCSSDFFLDIIHLIDCLHLFFHRLCMFQFLCDLLNLLLCLLKINSFVNKFTEPHHFYPFLDPYFIKEHTGFSPLKWNYFPSLYKIIAFFYYTILLLSFPAEQSLSRIQLCCQNCRSPSTLC